MKFLFFLFFISANIYAQEHSFLSPMGAYEGISANTGIGRDGSVGSVLYNPAGMASVKSSKLSASGSAFSQNEISINVEGEKESIKYFQTTPAQVTTIFNTDKFNWAFSILVPKTYKYDRISNTSYGVSSNSTVEDNETMFGPSIAFKLSPEFSIGLSVFGSKRDYRDTSFLYYEDNTGAIAQARKQDISGMTVFPIIGLLYKPTQALQLGLRIQAPSKCVSGSMVDNSKTAGDNTSLGVPNDDRTLKSDARFEKPAEIGLGVSWGASEQLNILFDVTHQFAKKYQVIKEDVFGEPIEFDFKDTQRFNLAFEYKTSHTDAMTLGFMYNPDPINDSDLNFYGGTIGYRSMDKIADSSVGFFYNHASQKDGQDEFAFTSYGVFVSNSINFLN